MTHTQPASILQHFSAIKDPRIDRRKRHKLGDIFFIALCAIISGADDWTSIALFGRAKEAWFTKVLGLENGIPSHDTFGNVFAMIDTKQFVKCFISWVEALSDSSHGEIIAIDGKSIRRSLDRANNKSAIHLVSAWATKSHLVLGQQKVDEKSNEISAIPKLLENLNIEGSVITIDAMGCQTKVASQIIARGADYMLSLKGNQSSLFEDVKTFFETPNTCPTIAHQSCDGGHGRIETRRVKASSNIEWLKRRHPHWEGLTSIIAVSATREIKSVESREVRYFISSLDASNPERLGAIVRAHWGIENNLHWVLDYAFNEDAQRTRTGNSAANFGIMRHVALNLLKADKVTKAGMKNKRLKAGWDDDYLLEIITKGRFND